MRTVLAVALAVMAGCSSTSTAPTTTTPTAPAPIGFTDLVDLHVTIGGRLVPLSTSGLIYERQSAEDFDEASRPGYDAISGDIRSFLACERDTWNIGTGLTILW